jgi:hypothetical protein
MLCDEIMTDGTPGYECDISCMLPTLDAAQKFTLSPEFATVAEALSNDYTGLVRVFDRCRLPYAMTWIEVAQADRPRFMQAGMHAEAFQVRPKRVGFLCTATRNDLSAWTTHLFWSTDLGCSCAPLAMRFDMIHALSNYRSLPTAEDYAKAKAEFIVVNPDMPPHPGWEHADNSVKLMMLHHTDPVFPNYGVPSPPVDFTTTQIDEFYKILGELGRADWAGEPAYLLAVIGLLNARNAVETADVDQHKLNRARTKRGKLPLFSHKVLKIAHRQQHRAYGNGEGRDDHQTLRGHFVRGHFKARASGVYFWHPHKRGDFSRGHIKKDYELT